MKVNINCVGWNKIVGEIEFWELRPDIQVCLSIVKSELHCMPRNSSSPSCFIFTYTVYTHIDGPRGARCEDAALISFPPLCLICSSSSLLAGPSEIALLLHTPSIHKVRWAEFITSHWGEMQSGEIYLLFFFFFTNDIKSGKGKSVICEIADHPGLSCLSLVTGRCSQSGAAEERKRMRRCLAQHVFAVSSSFLSSIVADNLAKADCVSTSFDEGRHRNCQRAT